ncbi:hypothetical protein Tco_0495834 [Tanacetum coccineum]
MLHGDSDQKTKGVIDRNNEWHRPPQKWLRYSSFAKFLCILSKTPDGHYTLRGATFWRKTCKFFNAFVRGPTLPAN